MAVNEIAKAHQAGRRLKRRALLSWGLIAASMALAAKSCDVALRFARPVAAAGEFGGKFDLGLTTDLLEADAPPLDQREGRFFLVRTPAGIVAFHKVCTHLSCLVTWDEQAGAFVCPCNGSQFSRDGQVLSGPAARDLDRFAVQLIAADGQVVAATDPQRGELIIPTPERGSSAAQIARGGNVPRNSCIRVLFVDGRFHPPKNGPRPVRHGPPLIESAIKQNNTYRFTAVPSLGVTVQRGLILDGLGKYLRRVITESDAAPVDVAQVLRESSADVLINYLPVGSEEGARFYRCSDNLPDLRL